MVNDTLADPSMRATKFSARYSFAASEYGRRGARNRVDRVRKALDSLGEQ